MVFSIENSAPNICSYVPNSPGRGGGVVFCRVFQRWFLVKEIEVEFIFKAAVSYRKSNTSTQFVWGNPPPLHTIAMTDVISRQTSHCDTHSRSSFARRRLTVDLILNGPNPFEENSQPTFSFYVQSIDGARIVHAQVGGRK